ncbi:hypothetical protein ACTHQN_06130 [Curtobacterium flaccumfaciens]|uniref:hypothetical protein n=1 Tax=Curtobacterium flaccumfaciens TaxID=2035 RepID=UPI003F81E31F
MSRTVKTIVLITVLVVVFVALVAVNRAHIRQVGGFALAETAATAAAPWIGIGATR